MDPLDLPAYLTPLQFATLTHCHKRQVLNAIATGRIRCQRLEGHTLMIPVGETRKMAGGIQSGTPRGLPAGLQAPEGAPGAWGGRFQGRGTSF